MFRCLIEEEDTGPVIAKPPGDAVSLFSCHRLGSEWTRHYIRSGIADVAGIVPSRIAVKRNEGEQMSTSDGPDEPAYQVEREVRLQLMTTYPLKLLARVVTFIPGFRHGASFNCGDVKLPMDMLYHYK